MSIAQGCFDVTKSLRKCQGVGVYFLLCLLSYQRALVIHMPSAASKRNTQPGKIKIPHTSRLFVEIKRITTNIILGDSRTYATETAFLESFSSCRTEPQLLVNEDSALMAVHKKSQVHHPEIFTLVSSTKSWEGEGNTNDPAPPHCSPISLLSPVRSQALQEPRGAILQGKPSPWELERGLKTLNP